VTCNAVKTDSIILTITVDRVDLQRQWEIEKLKRITALEEMLKAVKKEMVGLEGT
jgi:hypothetical protein